jgi:predicted nucleic acid-binding protein
LSTVVLLDAGPLGLLASPRNHTQVIACRTWLASLHTAGRRVLVPEIADYEVRRELIRIQSRYALANLDALATRLDYLPLCTDAMRLEAGLWAQARQAGHPTASDPALDGDVILAAQAIGLKARAIVATTNPGHLVRFVAADLWTNIAP